MKRPKPLMLVRLCSEQSSIGADGRIPAINYLESNHPIIVNILHSRILLVCLLILSGSICSKLTEEYIRQGRPNVAISHALAFWGMSISWQCPVLGISNNLRLYRNLTSDVHLVSYCAADRTKARGVLIVLCHGGIVKYSGQCHTHPYTLVSSCRITF
jgi:hypothetical protein